MDAKDLRIGNWVKNGNAYKAEVTISVLKQARIFSPILLNEEWLEKFGFKKNLEYAHIKDCDYKLGDFTVNFDNGVYFVMIYEKRLNEPKYVHQLQNLYFALTGEELKVKELV